MNLSKHPLIRCSDKNLIFISSLFLALLSIIAFCLNFFVFHYKGNNYFPPDFGGIGLIILLVQAGFFIIFGKDNAYYRISQEVFYFFLVFSLIALATNAAQLTPFKPVDNTLINIDRNFHIYLEQLMELTSHYPLFKTLLNFSYVSLAYQMAYLPLVLIILQRFNYLREYYILLLLTAVIGFSTYYFFPTMGPASFINSPYFTKDQFATGLKFSEIHQYKNPSTIEGGLVALPSFHTIWAVLCILLCRSIPILFSIVLIVNSLLIISCILLGWHYFIDLVLAFIILIIAYTLYRYCHINR